jgi:hypothetical protein
VLKTMQHIIADSALVPQADHGKALCRQRLMPEPPECLAGFGRTFSYRSILGISFDAVAIVHAHLIEMFGNGPPFVCDLIEANERGRRGMFPCPHFLMF